MKMVKSTWVKSILNMKLMQLNFAKLQLHKIESKIEYNINNYTYNYFKYFIGETLQMEVEDPLSLMK